MLNQALKTIDLQLFAEPGEGSDLFEEPSAEESLPKTMAAEAGNEETQAVPETETASAPLPNDSGHMIRVKYNGSEMELSREQAATLAQKGMNYDKVLEKLKAAENSEEFMVLDSYARQNGMTRQQYVKHLREKQAESLAESEMKEIKARYPELPDAAAKELAESRASIKQRAIEEKLRQEQEREKNEQLRPWQEFAKAYPEAKDFSSLPEDVRNDIANGEEPVSAMRKFELTEAKKEIETLKQQLATKEKNDRNKEKAIGSAASSSPEEPADAFMAGFNSF
jgi:hypothetical protein